MAKKLMAVLLAVFMIVPLALSPAFAEPAEEKTYTGSVYYDSDTAAQIDANMEGYSQLPGDNYPQKAYTISAEFYLDWIDSGTESKYGRIIWDIQGYSFGYDAYNQTIFVAKSGWTINSGTNFIDTVPYTLEEQTFYRFSFTVQENHIKGYVNGELVLDTDVEGLWEPNRYVIFWPTCVGMHIVETKVAYADGTVLQSGSGANSFDGITGFKDGAYVSGDIADQMSQNEWDGVAPIYKEPIDEEFVLAELNEAIAALEVIKDDIKYDSIIDTDFTGAARFEFGPSGYDRVEKGFSGPARVDMTFAWTENKDGENGSVIGGSFGTSTVFMGYALDSQKFIIAKSSEHYFGQPRPTDPDRIYAESEETYALEQGKGYLMTLVFEKDYVAILLNGEEVLTSDEFNYAGFKDSVFLMHCINVNLILADLTITNINTGVVYPAGTHNTNNELKGQDATLTGPKYYDSYKVIADAEAAYNRLPEDVKTDDVVVAKYQVIADAKAAYVAQAPAENPKVDQVKANIEAIGEVTRNSADAINKAERAYRSLTQYEKTLVENYGDLTAAIAYYDVLLPKLAAVEAVIADIGKVQYKIPNPSYPYENDGYTAVFTAGNGYSNMLVGGETPMNSDYTVEFDFQYVRNGANARFAGGGQNYNAGYNFQTNTWCIGACDPWGIPTPVEGSTYTEMELNRGQVYTYKLEARGNRITLYIDGEIVAESTKDAGGLVRVPGKYFVFYPANCTMNITNYSFWSFAASYEEPALEANLTGEALKNSTTWGNRDVGYFAGGASKVVAPEYIDTLSYIEAAEAAMATLTEGERAQIVNADVLAAARAEYDALAEADNPSATFTVGDVTVDASNIADYLQDDGSFKVPVSLKVSDLPKAGIGTATFGVSVEGATIAEIKPGSAITDDNQLVVVGPNNDKIIIADATATATEDAEIAVIIVSVPHDVKAGTEIGVALTLSEDPDDYLTVDVKNFVPVVNAGKVVFAVNGAVATLEKTDAVAPTCETEGSVEYWTDTVTGTKYSDAEANTVIEDVVVPALGHTLVHVEAKAPTREEAGNIEYWHCSVCDKYFADAEATQEITLEDTVIPAITAGDVNGDGHVNVRDVIAIMRHLAGWEDADFDVANADFNEDGRINNKDVLQLLLAIVNGTIA